MSSGVALFLAMVAARTVFDSTASVGRMMEPPPPPDEPPPPLLEHEPKDVAQPRRGRSLLMVGGMGIAASAVPACRRGIQRLVRDLKWPPKSFSTEDGDCEGGVCELPRRQPSKEAAAPVGSSATDTSGGLAGEAIVHAESNTVGTEALSPHIRPELPDPHRDAEEQTSDVWDDGATAIPEPQPDRQEADDIEDAVEADVTEAAVVADAEKAFEAQALTEEAPPPPPPLHRFYRALSKLHLETAAANRTTAFGGAAKLLAKYCENAAAQPYEPKFRRVRLGNAAFQKHLAAYLPHATACLHAVGFDDGTDEHTGEPILVMGTANAELLSGAARAARARLAALAAWPESLSGCLPATCLAIEEGGEPQLLERLSEELSAAHIPQLLAHGDNQERVASQLEHGGVAAAKKLVENLVELRHNLTEQQQQQQQQQQQGGGPHRVRHISDCEEWYDVLEEAGDGLVVVDFGATWCGPCKHVKPLFEQLSRQEAYVAATMSP